MRQDWQSGASLWPQEKGGEAEPSFCGPPTEYRSERSPVLDPDTLNDFFAFSLEPLELSTCLLSTSQPSYVRSCLGTDQGNEFSSLGGDEHFIGSPRSLLFSDQYFAPLSNQLSSEHAEDLFHSGDFSQSRPYTSQQNSFNPGPYLLDATQPEDDVRTVTSRSIPGSLSGTQSSTTVSTCSKTNESFSCLSEMLSLLYPESGPYLDLSKWTGLPLDHKLSPIEAGSSNPERNVPRKVLPKSEAQAAQPEGDQSGEETQGPVSNTYNLPSFSEAYACTDSNCHRSFRRPSDLRKHEIIHSDESGRHRCDLCPSHFYYAKDLSRHRRSLHRQFCSSDAHTCTICGREFVRRDKLIRHKKARHLA
ncbi:hypothetical protein EJ04DRAFT_249236 [Polyplosphaeria fusca]|uniref:C2H2-type domain-containing protein n=1 Tax=Polyplosphaeria fusca TaxID=682080 RepID=A0A9P4V3G5_9PLEO|nr:hypothetical protein EJ04DRAFT_249236 [Polyplosphaeria fusca]